MWGSLTVVIVAGLLGGLLLGRKSKRAVENAKRLANETGPQAKQGELAAKMRILDARGLKRRWREIVVRRGADGSLRATPYRPRVAASFDLSETRAMGLRKASAFEKWWFAGPTVLLADGDLGPVEFGFGTAVEVAEAARLFGRPELAANPDDQGLRS